MLIHDIPGMQDKVREQLLHLAGEPMLQTRTRSTVTKYQYSKRRTGALVSVKLPLEHDFFIDSYPIRIGAARSQAIDLPSAGPRRG